MPDKPDPAYLQWKAYFSMHVLGQTDPIHNPTIYLDEWWLHQSCPWSATVTSVEEFHRKLKYPDNCYHCHRECKGDYCEMCIDNPCWECGQVECGGYCVLDRCPICENGKGDMHKSCRVMFNNH